MYIEIKRYLEHGGISAQNFVRFKENAAVYLSAGRKEDGLQSLIFNMGMYYFALFFLGGCLFVLGSVHKTHAALDSIAIVAEQGPDSPPITLLTSPATTATIPAPPPAPPVPASGAAVARRGTIAGNTYAYGWCTWYAKQRRPDLPNNLGNANTWLVRARSQGIPTGSIPKTGAIGTRGNHLVYIERVNGDGTVFVSEMAYKGWNITSTRTAPANFFQYIY